MTMSTTRMISVGYRNHVAKDRIVAIVSPDSRPIKNMINGAKEKGKLIDATMGKKTKAVIITNSDHIILSANSTDTLKHRYQSIEQGIE
jgi:regulator of extracellular matrix RemA (YlzA/DUF370 family)